MAPLLTLLWLGWHLVEQDRLLERQQVQQRVERAGDLVVAALQRRLSQAQQELSSGTAQPARGVAVFAFPAALPEAPIATFDASDDLELRQRDPQGAIKLLRPLVARHDRAVAAGPGVGDADAADNAEDGAPGCRRGWI